MQEQRRSRSRAKRNPRWYQNKTLDPRPIQDLIRRTGLDNLTVAAKCEVSEKRLYDLFNEELVSPAVADRICVGLGTHLVFVYPGLYPGLHESAEKAPA